MHALLHYKPYFTIALVRLPSGEGIPPTWKQVLPQKQASPCAPSPQVIEGSAGSSVLPSFILVKLRSLLVGQVFLSAFTS